MSQSININLIFTIFAAITVPANGCPHIPDPENGNIDFVVDTTAPFEVGTTATYSCDQGFSLDEGDIVRTCEENDLTSWSGSAPSCVGMS